MGIIAPARSFILEEEVRYRASVNESVETKKGANVNHLQYFKFEPRKFILNGNYTGQTQTGLDGIYPLPTDCEIALIAMSNVQAGASGTTELDVKVQSSSGGSRTSIFSTTPKITSAAPDFAYLMHYPDGLLSDVGGTGLVLPVLSTSTFTKGQALSVDILDTMTNAKNISLEIYLRTV